MKWHPRLLLCSLTFPAGLICRRRCCSSLYSILHSTTYIVSSIELVSQEFRLIWRHTHNTRLPREKNNDKENITRGWKWFRYLLSLFLSQKKHGSLLEFEWSQPPGIHKTVASKLLWTMKRKRMKGKLRNTIRKLSFYEIRKKNSSKKEKIKKAYVSQSDFFLFHSSKTGETHFLTSFVLHLFCVVVCEKKKKTANNL